MKIPKILISKILSVVLIAISIGGAGYIGYSVVFGGGHSSGTMEVSAANPTTQVAASSVNTSTKDPQQSMQMATQKDTQPGQQNVGQSSTSAQTQPASSQQTTNSNVQTQPASSQQTTNSNVQAQQVASSQQIAYDPEAIKQSAKILQSRENLSKAITALNEAMAIMTLAPYAPIGESTANMDMGNAQNNDAPVVETQPDIQNQANVQAQPNTQPQTTSTPANTVMQNMGSKYDVEKMTQLHTGLYKMAVGKVLLDQLNNELVTQAELAYKNTLSPLQFYSNQYNLTQQYNSKLNQSFTFINEAANLVNINPYVSADGLALDNVRMENIHQSVYKLAEGVAALSLLSDEFTSQSISLASMVQAANMNVQAVNQNAQTANRSVQAANQSVQPAIHNVQTTDSNNTATSNATAGSIFSNFNVSGAVNVILILFVAGLILGMIGFAFSLIKKSGKDQTN